METLKVYVNDLPEWWVAKDKNHLHSLMFGSERDTADYILDWDPEDWEEVPETQAITIHEDEDRESAKVTKTAAEWAAENGPGFLCSSEY